MYVQTEIVEAFDQFIEECELDSQSAGVKLFGRRYTTAIQHSHGLYKHAARLGSIVAAVCRTRS